MANIRDVAKCAGVSVATASRVLNDNDNVQESTKLRVRQAMAELGYRPLRAAKVARPSERLTVMALVPDISNPFYASVVKGINDHAMSLGYNVLLCNTNYDRRTELEYVKVITNRKISGAIFFGPLLTREEMLEINAATRVVQCCEYMENLAIPHVSINNAEAMRSGMRHLLSLGHRDIALFTCENGFASTRLREKCYLEILEENGCAADPNFIIRCDSYEFKSGVRAMMQLLQLKKRPTAVFAVSDLIAIGAMQAAAQSGLRVPDDMAMLGFDDIEFSSMCSPTLTTLAQPSYDIGSVALKMLHQRIIGEEIQMANRFLEHELKIRQSTLGAGPAFARQKNG